MNFCIGGEQEVPRCDYFQTLTSSGRDSLRLIIESGKLQERVFLLPDFLCDVIPHTLKDYGIQYKYYNVQKDFSFELGLLHPNDVIYIVNYFGQHKCNTKELQNHTIIIDDVFSPFPMKMRGHSSWYSFNSLRKISPLADGSIIYSNHPLVEELIKLEVQTEFAVQKYEAKHKKFEFIYDSKDDEQSYLSLFFSAEKMLDNRKTIVGMSIQSQLTFAEFCKNFSNEQHIRAQNYQTVCQLLPEDIIPIQSGFYSFAPLLLNNRDSIRQRLREHRIFLPVHWPCSSILSPNIISIPLDSRYTPKEMQRICELIREYKN